MKYILYQAYGNSDVINEAIYSIFSLYKYPLDEIQIVIYTDNRLEFERYFYDKNILYRNLTKDLLAEWRGEIHFVHRVKIKILQDFFSVNQDSDVIYVDSDTFFIQDPAELFSKINSGSFLMHTMEGIIKDRQNPIFKKVFKFLYYNDITLSDSSKIRVPLETRMWNAGVISLNDSDQALLQKVLEFTDALYAVFPKHVVEQLAFSYFFQTYGEILATDSTVYHYWNFKEFRIVLRRFLDANQAKGFQFILNNIERIYPGKLIATKTKFIKMNGISRLIYKIRGFDWKKQLEAFDWTS